MTKILHISDIHFIDKEIIPYVNPKNALCKLFSEIIDRRIKIDLCLITGDLAHDGKREAYIELKSLFNSCPWPIKVIPGNHDDIKIGKELLGKNYWQDDIWQYKINNDLTVVGLTSSVEGHHHGELDDSSLAAFEKIAKNINSDWVIGIHHPPCDIGHWWMDGQGLIKGHKELLEIADKYNATSILCGHYHINSVNFRKKTPIVIAPSIAHEVLFDDEKERPLRFRAKEPRCLIHSFSKDDYKVSEITVCGQSFLVNGRNWLEEVNRTNQRLPAKKMDLP